MGEGQEQGFASNSVCGAHSVTCSVHNDWFLKNEKQEFGKSRFKMHWVVATWLITSLLGLGMGHNTLFEGRKNLLMLSRYVSFQYQNCVRCFPKISNRNET